MNNKGMLLLTGTVIIFLVFMIFFISLLEGKADELSVKTIGKSQLELLDMYYDGEFSMLYMEKCADLSAYSVLDNKEFKSSLFEREFLSKFKPVFEECLEDYPAFLGFSFSNLNYRFDDNTLVIESGDSVEFDSEVRTKAEEEKIKKSLGITAEQIDKYFREKKSPLDGMGDCFIEEGLESGIPVSAMVAITAHESNYGKSGLASDKCSQDTEREGPSYNLFSIKGGGGSAGSCKWETYECLTEKEKQNEKTILCSGLCADGSSNCKVLADFRAYHERCDSVQDFVNLIKKERYWEGKANCKPIKEALNDPEEFVRRVYACGYATDPKWNDGVIKIMRGLEGKSNSITGSAIISDNFGEAPITLKYTLKPRVLRKYDFIEFVDKISKADKIDCGGFDEFELAYEADYLSVTSEKKHVVDGGYKPVVFKLNDLKCVPLIVSQEIENIRNIPGIGN